MNSRDRRGQPSSVGERYRVLLEIGRTLAGTLSSEQLYQAIYAETARVLEAEGFFISIYDERKDRATVVFFADRGQIQRDVEIVYQGSDSEVLSERKAVMVNEHLDDRSLLVLGDAEAGVTTSAISAPMVHKGRVLGAISAQSYDCGAYAADDLDLLQGIADIAAVAVDNAQHVAELEARKREAEQIEEIGRALSSSLDPREVLGKVTDSVVAVLGVDGASVWLCEPDPECSARVAVSAGTKSLPIGLEWKLSGTLSETLIERRQPVVLNDLATSALVPQHLRSHLVGGSGMGAPLVLGDAVAGVLTAGTGRVRAFSEDDLGVLQRLANQASVALENARLHQSLQALSLTDPLTGLPNRRRLQIHLDKEVAAARRGRSLVVVVFDLDNFKHYNDTLGHVAGDDILRAFAQILSEENRAMNLVARYGGDEFVSVLSESNLDGARLYTQRVGERVATDALLSAHALTVSTGLAEFDRTSMKSSDDLIHAADADMYRAKGKRPREGRRMASP